MRMSFYKNRIFLIKFIALPAFDSEHIHCIVLLRNIPSSLQVVMGYYFASGDRIFASYLLSIICGQTKSIWIKALHEPDLPEKNNYVLYALKGSHLCVKYAIKTLPNKSVHLSHICKF